MGVDGFDEVCAYFIQDHLIWWSFYLKNDGLMCAKLVRWLNHKGSFNVLDGWDWLMCHSSSLCKVPISFFVFLLPHFFLLFTFSLGTRTVARKEKKRKKKIKANLEGMIQSKSKGYHSFILWQWSSKRLFPPYAMWISKSTGKNLMFFYRFYGTRAHTYTHPYP